MTKKEIEKYIDDYIDMRCFKNPGEARPYLIEGFNLGYAEKSKPFKSEGSLNFLKKKCLNCNGKGEVLDYDGEHYYPIDCRTCNGIGEINEN